MCHREEAAVCLTRQATTKGGGAQSDWRARGWPPRPLRADGSLSTAVAADPSSAPLATIVCDTVLTRLVMKANLAASVIQKQETRANKEWLLLDVFHYDDVSN